MFFKNFITNLRKYKISSLLNIFGLGVAFASAYILSVWVYGDLTFNSCLRDTDRAFRLQMQINRANDIHYSSFISTPLGHLFADANEELLVSYGRMYLGTSALGVRVPRGEREDSVYIQESWGYAGIPETMGFTLVDGNLEDLQKPNHVLLSESFATAHGFTVGEVMYDIYQRRSLTICGIFEDFSDYCWFSGLQMWIADPPKPEQLNDYRNHNYTYYYKLKDKALQDAFIENCYVALQALYKNEYATVEDLKRSHTISLTPLDEACYNPVLTVEGGWIEKDMAYVLLIILVVTLLTAFVNYFNFFMAMLPSRVHRMNIEKVFGAPLWRLRLSLLFESLGIILLALALGALIVVFVAPEIDYAALGRRSVDFSNNAALACKFMLLALFIGVVTAIYPIYSITSVPAAFAVKKSFGNSKHGRTLRYSLLGIQFVITIAFIVFTLFVRHQYEYMMNYDMGFDRDNVFVVNNNNFAGEGVWDALTHELSQSPCIEDVTFIFGSLVMRESRMLWWRNVVGRPANENISFSVLPVAWNFLRFYGIEVVEGRDFLPEDEKAMGTFIFNEAARDAYNLKVGDLVGGWNSTSPVVGFCKNFNFRPLDLGVVPMALYVCGKTMEATSLMNVRGVAGVEPDTIVRQIEEAVNKYLEKSDIPCYNANNKMSLHTLNEEIAFLYGSQQTLFTIVSIFSIISIILSLMGVFGLVFFETQYRRREIALRRVHGGTVGAVMRMLVLQYMKIVFVSALVAFPLSYLVVVRWLEDFVYPVPITPWIFLFALLLVMAVVAVIVVARSYKVVSENPINSLYTE